MVARVLILLRARLAAQSTDAALPFAALMMQAFITSVVCGLVRDDLPPFAYALVALSTSAALVAVPLLGELAGLLVADEAAEWIRAQPVRASELHLARTAHLMIALVMLSLGSLVPAALIATNGFDVAMRVELIALGLAQSCAIAATLLLVQALLRGRAQPLLVAAQAALFVGVLFGASVGLRAVPHMVAWHSPSDASSIGRFPPAWFAAPLSSRALEFPWNSAAVTCGALALATLLLLPAPPAATYRRNEPLLAWLLIVPRKLAARWWVRGRERAMFEFLFDALPRERDFVIRTYPLLAVPVGFLWFSARGESVAAREGWLSLLLFIPGAYLPLLSAHVPASTSHRARWIVDTAPLSQGELDNGAMKAIVVRFLLPLYALLAVLGVLLDGASIVARLALPGLLAAILVLRVTWSTCVTAPPLSTPPDEMYVNRDWLGMLGGVGLGLTLLSIVAAKYVHTPWQTALLIAVLLAFEIRLDRKQRASTLQPV